MEFILALVLGLSLVFNLALVVAYLRRPKQRKSLDITAEELLHDFTRRGQAILRVEVLNPSDLMLRSPKH